jgi:ABC-type sugar transport system ATPase subunit
MLEIHAVSKRYGNTIALDQVSLELPENEVLGVVGPNGSGKSTLTKVIVGAEKPDGGEMVLDGRPFSPENPRDAEKLGISIVYQESALTPDLRVYEWLFLGAPLKRYWHLRHSEMKRRAREALFFAGLDVDCDPDSPIKTLSPQTRKLVEISRAFLGMQGNIRRPIIILDEPLAGFSEAQTDYLKKRILELKRAASFLFISHVLSDVLEISDRICVLRDGKVLETFDMHAQAVSEIDVHKAITSKEFSHANLRDRHPSGETIFKVNNLSKAGNYDNVSFDLRRGEILGLYGPPLSGASEIAKTIMGLIRQDEGTIEKNGQPLEGSILKRIDAGMAYCSGDHIEQVFLFWPVRENISITNLAYITRKLLRMLSIADRSKEREMAVRMVEKLSIKTPSILTLCGNLSGGSRQKVSLAKWLARKPEVLVLENPTLGIDVGTREELYEFFDDMRQTGQSIILISSDWDEVSRVCDRVFQVSGGRIGEVSAVAEDSRLVDEK